MRMALLVPVFAALLVIAAPSLSAGPSEGDAAKGTEVALKYKAWRTFEITLPAETFRKVSGAFDFTAVGGKRYGVEVVGSNLGVDTDADGEMEAKVEGKSGFLRFKGDDGFRYAIRLVNAGTGWRYAAAGGRVGKIDGVRVTLIDQDGNGSYADFGRDAMIVGSSKHAAFLSRVVNVGGRLRRIEVAKDGSTLRHAPYTGPAGTLDVRGKFDTHAKLLSAVVRNDRGDLSFDLARAEEGLRVPAGRYVLHSGKLGLGESEVRVRTGRAAPMEVSENGRVSLAWGGPVQAEFAYRRAGDEITFTPDTLHYYGRAGEEYFGWAPFGKSPEFSVVDAKTRTEIAKAIFTGC